MKDYLAKKCKWYEFHKWINIYSKIERKLLGEIYYDYFISYKQCEKCGIIKGIFNNGSNGYWKYLSNDETKIIKRHIVHDTIKNVLAVE